MPMPQATSTGYMFTSKETVNLYPSKQLELVEPTFHVYGALAKPPKPSTGHPSASG